MESNLYVIAVGNAFDGIKLYGDKDGQPFTSAASASETAELETAITDGDWYLVKVEKSCDGGQRRR